MGLRDEFLKVISWFLGFLRLFAQTKNFVPATMKSTKTQVWVRIYNLPLEYWRPRVIFSFIRDLGTPLSLDEHTMRKNRGMFARVVVDIDLLSPLPDHLLVEHPDFAFVALVWNMNGSLHFALTVR